MSEQSIESWSRVFPSTKSSQNALQDTIRRTTDESILNEYDLLHYGSEDVVIHCPKCDTYVKVETLRNHKAYHKALETLQWTKKNPPRNLSSLVEQRNAVLSQLKDKLFKMTVKHRNTHPPDGVLATSAKDSSAEILSHIEELNRAFEYLKNDIDPLACSLTSLMSADAGSENKNRKQEIDKFYNTSFTSKLSCVSGVGICSTQNQMYRRDMEDAVIFKDCFLAKDEESPANLSYFAVFDGYHGSTAASVASRHLHDFLKNTIMSCLHRKTEAQPTIDDYRKATCFQDGFKTEGGSKDVQTLKHNEGQIQNPDDIEKLSVCDHFADLRSKDSGKEISENCKEGAVSNSIDSERKQSKNLDDEMSYFEYDYHKPNDPVNKNSRNQLLDNEDEIPDKILNGLNRLQLERNSSQNNELCKENKKRPESMIKSQFPEACIPGETNSKEIDQKASISAAFKMAYKHTDVILSYGVGETSRVRWSGCSAVTVLIESPVQNKEQNKNQDPRCQRQFSNDRLTQRNSAVSSSYEKSPTSWSAMVNPEEVVGRLYVANVGNVQAFLVKGNRAYRVTKKHTPQNNQEKDRILQQGGFFTQSRSECLVNGVLKTTRGLGNHGDDKIRRCVLPVPSIYCTDIEQQSQLLIIASAGVWDVLSGQEVASLLVQLLPMNRVPAPSRVSTSLMQLFNNRLSIGLSCNTNEHIKDSRNQPKRCQLTESSSQKNSQRKEQKETSKSARNEEYNLRDVNMSAKSGLCSKSEENGKPDHVGSLSGVESEDSKRNIQRVIPQSEICQHFGQVMSRYLVQAAMLAGSRQNITAMVVILPGSGI